MKKTLLGLMLLLAVGGWQSVQGQVKKKPAVSPTPPVAQETPLTNSPVAATAAYAEVLANRVEAEADLKVLTLDYNDDTPQVKAKKLERDLIARQIRWLEALPASSQPKLTAALGRLLVRKAQAEANLKSLSENYADEHPLVKKARARLGVYNSEIEKLLQ